jgi:AraC-like DNA-binding protein
MLRDHVNWERYMTCNLADIFMRAEQLLSENPEMRLCELEKQLGCSPPTIRNAIRQYRSIGYRDYRKAIRLEKGKALLEQGYSAKAVAFELGYKWPENFTRLSRKSIGCSALKIKMNI